MPKSALSYKQPLSYKQFLLLYANSDHKNAEVQKFHWQLSQMFESCRSPDFALEILGKSKDPIENYLLNQIYPEIF